jgi:hypothetical protein
VVKSKCWDGGASAQRRSRLSVAVAVLGGSYAVDGSVVAAPLAAGRGVAVRRRARLDAVAESAQPPRGLGRMRQGLRAAVRAPSLETVAARSLMPTGAGRGREAVAELAGSSDNAVAARQAVGVHLGALLREVRFAAVLGEVRR